MKQLEHNCEGTEKNRLRDGCWDREIWLTKDGWFLDLQSVIWDSADSAQVKIKWCPFCGKELNND